MNIKRFFHDMKVYVTTDMNYAHLLSSSFGRNRVPRQIWNMGFNMSFQNASKTKNRPQKFGFLCTTQLLISHLFFSQHLNNLWQHLTILIFFCQSFFAQCNECSTAPLNQFTYPPIVHSRFLQSAPKFFLQNTLASRPDSLWFCFVLNTRIARINGLWSSLSMIYIVINSKSNSVYFRSENSYQVAILCSISFRKLQCSS